MSEPYRVTRSRRCDRCCDVMFLVVLVALCWLFGGVVMLWFIVKLLFMALCVFGLVSMFGLLLGTIHQQTKNKKQL